MQQHVLEYDEWPSEPGIAFRRFAQALCELHQRGIHGEEQSEHGEVRGEFRGSDDACKNPETRAALEDLVITDARFVRFSEHVRALDFVLSGSALVVVGFQRVDCGAQRSDLRSHRGARRLNRVLHLDRDAISPLSIQLHAFHGEHLLGLDGTIALNVMTRQALFRPLGSEPRCVLLDHGEFTIEPVVRISGDRVDAGARGIVVRSARPSEPRSNSSAKRSALFPERRQRAQARRRGVGVNAIGGVCWCGRAVAVSVAGSAQTIDGVESSDRR